MRLATFLYENREAVGVAAGTDIIPVPGVTSMEDLIRKGLPSGLPDSGIPLSEVALLAPIPRPSHDVICLGMNFADHTNEAAKFHPTMVRENYAVYFSKRVNEAVPDRAVANYLKLKLISCIFQSPRRPDCILGMLKVNEPSRP